MQASEEQGQAGEAATEPATMPFTLAQFQFQAQMERGRKAAPGSVSSASFEWPFILLYACVCAVCVCVFECVVSIIMSALHAMWQHRQLRPSCASQSEAAAAWRIACVERINFKDDTVPGRGWRGASNMRSRQRVNINKTSRAEQSSAGSAAQREK